MAGPTPLTYDEFRHQLVVSPAAVSFQARGRTRRFLDEAAVRQTYQQYIRGGSYYTPSPSSGSPVGTASSRSLHDVTTPNDEYGQALARRRPWTVR
jgi:hypothetical protein